MSKLLRRPTAASSPVERVLSRDYIAARMARLALKELRETLRDRRTIITLLLMPVLIYPLLSIAFQKLLLSSLAAPASPNYAIGVETEADGAVVEEVLKRGYLLLKVAERPTRADDENQQEPGPADALPTGVDQIPFSRGVFPDLKASLGSLAIDIGIRVTALERSDRRPSVVARHRFELLYRPQSQASDSARELVEKCLGAVNEDELRSRLNELGGTVKLPADIVSVAIEESEGSAVSLATVVPLILVLMTVTGAIYPAIDLTAGERERGTLETLIAAPVPRMGLLLGKYVAVLTVAILTGTVNLVAMTVTVQSIGMESLLFGDGGMTLYKVIQVFALMILFAAFFSAMLLVLTSFARSFKEAQAYLIPLMLVALTPGLLSLTPGLKMSTLLAVAPMVNIVLLARDVMQGTAVPVLALISIVSTAIYALLALSLAARIFGTDAILYGSQGELSDLFRRPDEIQQRPTVATAMLTLAVIFPGFILLGNLLARLAGASMQLRLAASAAVTVLLFVAFPSVIAAWRRIRLRDGFRLMPPSWAAVAGAVLMGASLWPFAYELELFTLDQERIEQLRNLFGGIKQDLESVPLIWKLAALALVPAVCEEIFFRGFLFSALRNEMSAAKTVVLTGVLFGLFHVVVRDALFFERLLPSTFLGLILGAVCERTGSVLPGMALHAIHNGLLLSMAHFEDRLRFLGIGDLEQEHLPKLWLLAAAAVAIVGGILILTSRRLQNSRQLQ